MGLTPTQIVFKPKEIKNNEFLQFKTQSGDI